MLITVRNQTFEQLRQGPGCTPYVNSRSFSVQQAYQGLCLADFLAKRHPHVEEGYWRAQMAAGTLWVDNRKATADMVVAAGARLRHEIPNYSEPPVSTQLKAIYEDDALLVLSKPAPLPVHASGRFNKNTVLGILAFMFAEETFKPVHRLDANTTGVMLLAKSKQAAKHLGLQFENRAVIKHYIAQVLGMPTWQKHLHKMRVSKNIEAGGKRQTESSGQDASALFECLHDDGATTFVLVKPKTGRTNQIRLHLQELGHPIVGDPVYPDGAESTPFVAQETMHLHAHSISIVHPLTDESMTFSAELPSWAKESSSQIQAALHSAPKTEPSL